MGMGIDLWRIGSSAEERLAERVRGTERDLGAKQRNSQAAGIQRVSGTGGNTGPVAATTTLITLSFNIPDANSTVLVGGNATLLVQVGTTTGNLTLTDSVDFSGLSLGAFTNTIASLKPLSFNLGSNPPAWLSPWDWLTTLPTPGAHTLTLAVASLNSPATVQSTRSMMHVTVI